MVVIFYLFCFTTLIGALEPFLGLRSIYTAFSPSERTIGFFGNPNETSLQANFTFVLSIYLVLKNRISYALTLIISFLSIYTSLSTFSKMGIITTAVLVLFFILFLIIYFSRLNAQSKTSLIKYFAIGIGGILFVFVPNANSYYNNLSLAQQRRIDNIGKLVVERQFDNNTTSYRGQVFKEAFILISRKPLIGYGTHTFSYGGMFSREDIGVHNTFLKIFGECGVIPFTMFIYFIIVYFIKSIKLPDKSYTLLTVGVMLAFIGFAFADHTALYMKFGIALLGIMVGLIRLVSNDINE